ncbi:MAG: zinc ABC transporter substrate-binding protein [Candidatus Gracilibacteria bacterium]|nr:zinc ABC transporter substrate-binding protein [Candidatus Gracilibacteria bacterium]
MKKILSVISLIFIGVSCSQIEHKHTTEEKKGAHNEVLGITTSILPLASITNYIGGEYVKTTSLIPAGVSPHGFDLTPNQMVTIQKSDLIVSLGYDHIDGFLEKAIDGKNTLIATQGVKMMKGSDDHNHEEHDENENHEDHDEHEEHSDVHEMDPHVWTSAENALIIAQNIQNKLSELQPEHRLLFQKNYNNFETELTSLREDFLGSTKGKTQPEFIVFHDAYNYLFEELAIDQKKKLVFRTNILSDPNSTEMKEIIDEITNHGVKNFYKEPQFNSDNLDNLADQYDLVVDILNPIGSDDSKNGYIQNYRENLTALKKIYE